MKRKSDQRPFWNCYFLILSSKRNFQNFCRSPPFGWFLLSFSCSVEMVKGPKLAGSSQFCLGACRLLVNSILDLAKGHCDRNLKHFKLCSVKVVLSLALAFKIFAIANCWTSSFGQWSLPAPWWPGSSSGSSWRDETGMKRFICRFSMAWCWQSHLVSFT